MDTPGIKKLRKRAESSSQSAVARELDVSRSYVCHVLAARKKPGMSFRRQAWKLYRIPMHAWD
jgi:biotin operon repressor